MKNLTTKKIHSIIRNHLQLKCSKYSISQRINRNTYDLHTKIAGVYGVVSGKYINEIATALTNAQIKFDKSTIERGFLKIIKAQ